ncbi:hypothetical protein L2E82_39812 [Cichorium intybus]|uniref:Uncharacterized protein n=1 Tax=Cichorium intybus TaxID=13427 RepID=A0ACB9AIK9_CICIN|nr:hypothetical protein L2E82_39812 [Cichorium intybus]
MCHISKLRFYKFRLKITCHVSKLDFERAPSYQLEHATAQSAPIYFYIIKGPSKYPDYGRKRRLRPVGSTDVRDLTRTATLHFRIEELGYHMPTEIQKQALPVLFSGQDCILHAQTGSGKTLAYLLQIFSVINTQRSAVQALIVVSTRELGMQVAKVARILAAKPDQPVEENKKLSNHRGVSLAVRDVLTSDPYFIIRMGKQKLKTRVVKNSINPVWDEALALSVLEPLPVKLGYNGKIKIVTCRGV